MWRVMWVLFGLCKPWQNMIEENEVARAMDEVDVEGCDDVRDCEWRRETRYAERELKWNKLKVSLNFHIDSRMNTMWCTSLYIAYTLCSCVYPSAFMKAPEKMKAISSLTLLHTFCIQPSVQLFLYEYMFYFSLHSIPWNVAKHFPFEPNR